jgi:ADP-ribosylglycohydrolase
MKLAPLALLQTVIQDKNDIQIEDFTKMTHDNSESVMASMVHRDVLSGLLIDEINSGNILENASDLVRFYEDEFGLKDNYLSRSLGKLASLKLIKREKINQITPLNGFRSDETLVMAYASFARESELPESIFEAIKLGGDTDSIASIVATMGLFKTGSAELPEDSKRLNKRKYLVDTGIRFGRFINDISNQEGV